jgi:hypothetical protein
MTSKHVIVLAAALSLPLGCGPTGTLPPAQALESLYFEPIGQGFYASLADTTEVVFRDPEEWQQFSTALRPRKDFVASDFEQTMVLLALVPVPTGGHSVAFESVDKMGDEIVATYTLTKPGADCMTIASLTQPFEAIAVRKAAGRVRFVRNVELLSCAN